MPDDGAASGTKGQIPTNLRLLLVLEEVAKRGIPVSSVVLADALDLPKPTMHRLLVTAEEQGFLQRGSDGRSYGPGRRMRKLAANTLSSQRIRTERLFVMKHLADTVEETCNLAAPSRYGMVYLDRVETHWPLRIQLPIGTQVPFHSTASGKMYLSSLRVEKLDRILKWTGQDKDKAQPTLDRAALLKDLDRIRKRGYATDNEEFMTGMVALAVPIKDSQGRLLTTLSIHAPTQRHSVDSLEQNLPALKDAAVQIEQLI